MIEILGAGRPPAPVFYARILMSSYFEKFPIMLILISPPPLLSSTSDFSILFFNSNFRFELYYDHRKEESTGFFKLLPV